MSRCIAVPVITVAFNVAGSAPSLTLSTALPPSAFAMQSMTDVLSLEDCGWSTARASRPTARDKYRTAAGNQGWDELPGQIRLWSASPCRAGPCWSPWCQPISKIFGYAIHPGIIGCSPYPFFVLRTAFTFFCIYHSLVRISILFFGKIFLMASYIFIIIFASLPILAMSRSH